MQLATLGILLDRGYEGRQLMLEALLRRGFLAFEEADEVHLAVGSTDEDLEALSAIVGHELLLPTHPHARARMPELEAGELLSVAKAIVSIPENRGRMTPMFTHRSWRRYRNRRWGAKVSVGPRGRHGALDVGVALLVKVLPLARVSTALSCDGHGEGPARIVFASRWDAVWCEEVFRALGYESWEWKRNNSAEFALVTEGDDLSPMLDRLQTVARRLFDRQLSEELGRRRANALEDLRASPRVGEFQRRAREALVGL